MNDLIAVDDIKVEHVNVGAPGHRVVITVDAAVVAEEPDAVAWAGNLARVRCAECWGGKMRVDAFRGRPDPTGRLRRFTVWTRAFRAEARSR